MATRGGDCPSTPSDPPNPLQSSTFPTSGGVHGVGLGSMTFLASGFSSPVTGRLVQQDRKFTESILRHGFYRDNTLTAATKSKERHLQQLKRNQQSMDRLAKTFNRETKNLIKLQKKLAKYQQEMVFTAQQKFAVPYLQAIIRGYLARKRYVQRRSVRLIEDVYKFRLHFRKLVTKLRIIQRAVIIFLVSKKISNYARRLRAVMRLQSWYHRHWLLRRAILRTTVIRMWNHCQLFGITRAVKRIVPAERHRYILNRFIKSFIWKSRLRRLLNPLLMRQIFFSLFQSDIYSEINNAQCFFLPSTPTPSLLLPCRRSGYSSYHPLFQALQIKELRRSTLQTLQYVLRAQHFKFFPFTKLPSSALPTLDIDSLSELNYMKRLMMNEDHSSPSLSSSELQAFRKIHLKTLRVASYSQLETEGLFYLDMIPTAQKYCPYILRDLFRLRSFEDILIFLHSLSSVLSQNPSLLSTDLEFPQSENSSVKTMYEFSINPNAASILKRKRVFNFPTITMKPFQIVALAVDIKNKKMRYQRRGGAMINIGGNTPPKLKAKKEELKTKAEKLREQKAILSMAAMEARQTQKKLDMQSGNIGDGAGLEESVGNLLDHSAQAVPVDVNFSEENPSIPVEPFISPSPPPPPALSNDLVEDLSQISLTQQEDSSTLSQTNLPETCENNIPEDTLVVHHNSSNSTECLTFALPTKPCEAEEEEMSAVYLDDFEPESRGSSRSSRRCMTPQKQNNSTMFPPIPISSRPSSSAMENLRSPTRPEGPAPSRRSFRESLGSR